MKLEMINMREEDIREKEVQSVHFNIHYNKSKQYEPIVAHLLNIVGDEGMKKEVRSLVTNTARMLKSNGMCMKIPRDRNRYTGNSQGLSHSRMMLLLDLLEEYGMINIYIGGVMSYGMFDADVTKCSIVETLPPLIDLFSGVNKELVSVKLLNPVEIKERGTKNRMHTQGVTGVKDIKERVEMFNTALIESRISLKGVQLPDQSYKRVFIENLKTGGRWYNSCGGVQTMEKGLRPFLQIDGEDLVELDFSAIHPNICYEKIGATLPEGFDPYGIGMEDIYVDNEAVNEFKLRHGLVKYNPLRNLVKMATMIGLNCKSLGQSSKALSQDIGNDRNKIGSKDEHKALYYGLQDVVTKDILEKVQEHNHLISQYFFSDAGVELQFIDSEILDDIICDTLAIGEVLLPWHDGVMVKKAIAEQVKDFMYKAWYKQFKSIKFCKVDYK